MSRKTSKKCGRFLRAAILLLMLGGSPAAGLAQNEMHDGFPVGYTDEGHPYIGNPDASVILEEWSDYLCPFCYRHYIQTVPQILELYVRSGQLKLVFRDLPLTGLHPTAPVGHVAARCAGTDSASIYWQMHDALFARQSEWNSLPDPGPFLEGVASELGADIARYRACIDEGQVAQEVTDSVADGMALGYNGTPSFRFVAVNGEKTYTMSGAHPLARFAHYADPLVAGEEPPEEPVPEPPEMPLWAKVEGFEPDPDRPGFNMAGDAYKGNPKAAVAVIEFNDFQCPACQTHALEAQPIIDERLIDTGRILWIDKHLPLRIHEHAAVAAVAAECAGDQERYWDMHRALHAESDRWANDDADSSLIALAGELDLDLPSFQSCLNSRKGLERVLDDLYDAQGIITRAPTFVIVQGGRGSATGPLEAEQFISMLEQRIESVQSVPESAGDSNIN